MFVAHAVSDAAMDEEDADVTVTYAVSVGKRATQTWIE